MDKILVTREELNKIREFWGERTVNLRLAWLDDKRSFENRMKALYLWSVMYIRMNKIVSIYTKMSQRSYSGYQPAGFTAKNMSKESVIKNNPAGYP